MRTAVNTPKMTESEYIAFEEKAQVLHEMINGKLYTMAGTSKTLNLICIWLVNMILNQLKGRKFAVFQENIKVQITHEKDYTYPDVVLTFDEQDISTDESSYIIRKPILIAEVLSPSMRLYDRTDNFIQYRKMSEIYQH